MYGVIYKVTNTVNGHIYIGQTKTALGNRWSKHCSDARSGAGWILAAAIRKHGREAFTVEVVEECPDKDALNAAEIAWILKLQPTYNSCGGGGGLGSPSPEVRAKIAKAVRGKKRSEQTRLRMSIAQIDRHKNMSNEERKKRSLAMLGNNLTKYRKPATEEAKKILAERNRARRKHPIRTDLLELYAAHGATTRNEKIALSAKHGFKSGTRKRHVGELNPMYGKEKPEEIKRLLSEKMAGEGNPYFGKKHSEETRAKMRAAHADRPPVTCPHCGKEGQLNNMKRWHFDNCRSKA
jgi:group I intron endonuclease